MMRFLAALGLLLALSACSVTVTSGRLFDRDALDRLEPGASTREEAIRRLGRPYGCGRAQFPDDPEARDLCYFYRGEASLSDSRGTYLLVFFRNDRYDGYMWFSSLPRDAAAAPAPASSAGLNFPALQP